MAYVDADKRAKVLGVDYNLLNADDSFYQEWEITADDHVMRLASIPESTRCLVKFDPTELPPPE